MRPTNIVLLSCLILCQWPATASTQSLSARFSTGLYSWENQFADSTSTSSFRGFQSASLDLRDVGVANLSFHGYARGLYDFNAKTEENPDYRIYQFYARWHNAMEARHKIDTRLGRQQILTGLRSPVVDAARVDYGYADYFTLMGYFGSLPPLDGRSANLKPWQRRAFGGKLSTSRAFGTNMALSYYDKSREAESYYRENVISDANLIRLPRVKERLVGYDVNRRFMDLFTVYGHAEYNALEKEMQTVSGDVHVDPSDNLWWAAEYVYRRPTLTYRTFFTAFDDLKGNQEIWFRFRYRINSCWSANGDFANVFYTGKDAQRYGIGATYVRTSLSLMRRSGYGGTMTAVSLSSYHPVNTRLGVYGSVSYASYKLDDYSAGDVADPFSTAPLVFDATNSSLTAIGRVSYQFTRAFTVDGEGQFLSQNIKSSALYAGNKYDARFFLRANYWIFQKL